MIDVWFPGGSWTMINFLFLHTVTHMHNTPLPLPVSLPGE